MNSVCENERFKSWWPTSWRLRKRKLGRGSVMANKLTMRTTEEVSVLANELAMLLWVEGAGGWTVTFNED